MTVPAALGASQIRDAFRRLFPDASNDPVLAFAPGRVNLIGDHIDYCGGSVLPMPIQYGTWVAAAPGGGAGVHARSNRQPPLTLRPGDTAAGQPVGHWGRFVSGAIGVLSGDGVRVPEGLLLYAAGDIPASGLSSSASFSVALLLAIGAVSGQRAEGLALALAAQRIEHEYVGVACGLMDQAAVVLGHAGAALRFDCASRLAEPVALPAGLSIVVADSGVPRTLAGSAYNERRRELDRVAQALALDPATLAVTLPVRPSLADRTLARRARHVASEQRRVNDACTALGRGDLKGFGALLNASHASLRDDYEVSCTELDALAETFRSQPGCYGARMTGAGFGGAVVAAMAPDQVDAGSSAAASAHRQRFGTTPRIFVARSHGGARVHG